MPETNQSLLENSFEYQKNKFKQKKIVFVLLIATIVLAIVLSVFYFFRLKLLKPISLEKLDQYQTAREDEKNFESNLKKFDDYGSEFSCEIFIDEIFYPGSVFSNFIIQAATPCWFYDNNSELSSVNVPIIVEDTSIQRWTHIGLMEFIPVFSEMDKELAIEAFSQYVFVGENDGSKPELYDSVLVKLMFATQKPYYDYHEAHFELTGEYVFKSEYYDERFLRELSDQHQNKEAVDYFIKNGNWNQELDDYLFYHYAERRLVQ